MPFSAAPPAEPIDTSKGYGITELGPQHPSLEMLGARFAKERNWWLATSRPDGRPHAVPVWGVVAEGMLIFGSDPLAVKTRNIAFKPAVVLHLESGDDVCILEGTAQRLTPDEIPPSFSQVYKDKYDIELDASDPDARYYQVHPITLMAWDETDFVNTAARWRFPRL